MIFRFGVKIGKKKPFSIVKEEIVLGFHPEYKREFTGFAVA